MIKKVLFLFICTFSLTVTLRAQMLSESEFIDYISKGNEKCCEAAEKLAAENGMKLKMTIYYDSDNRALVFSYKTFSSDLFNSIDIEAALKGGINGMLSGLIGGDSSGRELELMIHEFKIHNINFRVEFLYKKKVKSATATPAEIQRLASFLY